MTALSRLNNAFISLIHYLFHQSEANKARQHAGVRMLTV